MDSSLARRALPNYDTILEDGRDLTDQKWSIIEDTYNSELKDFLSKSGLSENGQRILEKYFYYDSDKK